MNSLSNMIKVAVVGGEGIGPEVTAQSHRVLNWFATKRNVPMTLREAQFGLIPYRATGKVLPPDTAEAMDEADAIMWGATGGPETTEVPAAARKAGYMGPFIVLSGSIHAEEIQTQLHAEGFMAKPFDPDELIDTVHELLASAATPIG